MEELFVELFSDCKFEVVACTYSAGQYAIQREPNAQGDKSDKVTFAVAAVAVEEDDDEEEEEEDDDAADKDDGISPAAELLEAVTGVNFGLILNVCNMEEPVVVALK